jgi:hypothetical protein
MTNFQDVLTIKRLSNKYERHDLSQHTMSRM